MRRGTSLRRVLRSRYLAAWLALAALLGVSAVIAPSTITSRSLNNLVFFASILGLAALGQQLVITIGGLDLSVASQATLSAVVFARLVESSATGDIVVAAGFAVLACLVVGLVNGLTVTVLRITPLIATLAVGTIAMGVAAYAQGNTPNAVPDIVNTLTIGRFIGGAFALVTVVWVLSTAAVAGIFQYTSLGRRFVAVGASPRAARTLGIGVDGYKALGYVGASVFYALAGLALAGIAGRPTLGIGEPYLLGSIAAVVIGGTALGGGAGSASATTVGALFMTQVNAVTLSLRASTGAQLIVQAAVIAVAMALYRLRPVAMLRRALRARATPVRRASEPDAEESRSAEAEKKEASSWR